MEDGGSHIYDVIVKASQGDVRSKKELFGRYIRQIYFICVTLRGYLPDTPELCADLFADMYRSLPGIDSVRGFERDFYSRAISYCSKRAMETPVKKERGVEAALDQLAEEALRAREKRLMTDYSLLVDRMAGEMINYMPINQTAALLYFDMTGGSAEEAAAYPFLDAAKLDVNAGKARENIARSAEFLKGRGIDVSDLTADMPATLRRLAESCAVPGAVYDVTGKRIGLNLRPEPEYVPDAHTPAKPLPGTDKTEENGKNAARRNVLIVVGMILAVALIFLAIRAIRARGNANDARQAAPEDEAVNYWDGDVADSFSGGDGTEASPYLISGGDELAYLAREVANGNAQLAKAHYELENSVSLNTLVNYGAWDRTPPANKWTSIGGDTPFEGSFNGNGHTVSGLYQNGSGYGGLFGKTRNAVIKDLKIDNSYINVTDAAGGAIAEAEFDASDVTVLERLSFSGSVLTSGETAGGLIGRLSQGAVLTRSGSAGSVESGGAAGGLVGEADAAGGRISVNNSYSRAQVVGKTAAGGLAGVNHASDGGDSLILKCYFAGRCFISGQKGQSSATAGANSADGATASVSNCFYLEGAADAACVNGEGGASDKVASLSQSEMKQDRFFTDFDFTDFWEFSGENGYYYPTPR